MHIDTKYSPFELVFGRLPKLPSYITEDIDNDETVQYCDYVNRIRSRLSIAFKDVENRLNIVKNKRIVDSNRNLNASSYKRGDKILIRKEIGNKLNPLYDGPFEIIELNGENVIFQRGTYLDEVHKNRTKLFTI